MDFRSFRSLSRFARFSAVFSILGILGLLGILAFSGCDEEDEAWHPPTTGVVTNAAPEGLWGPIVVRDPNGNLVLILPDDSKRDEEGGHTIIIKEMGRSEPFPGKFIEFEQLSVPFDRLPEELLQPIDPARFPEGSEERAREYKRLRELEREISRRYVVVTEEMEGGEPVTVIRIFDGNGRLIQTLRKKGKFKKVIVDEANGRKTILTEDELWQHWLAFDYQTGAVVSDSQAGVEKTDELIDVEQMQGNIIVIQKWRGGTWVRVRIFGPNGQLIHVVDIPGNFIRALEGKRTTKAIVVQFRDQVFCDLIEIITGAHSVAIDASGIPQNGISGIHRHIQYDLVQNQERFVEVVYDDARGETTVRILDGNGHIVSTQVMPGEFKDVRAVGGKKVFAISRAGGTDAVVVDLLGGQQTKTDRLPGNFRYFGPDSPGKVNVVTAEPPGKEKSYPVSLQ